MMKARYGVKLTYLQRQKLIKLIKNGKEKAKKLTHARILLLADGSKEGPGLKAKAIAANLNIHEKTIHRVRQRFAEEGLESALNRKEHKAYKLRKLDGEQEAKLVAICCSNAPAGRTYWTLELLSKELVRLNIVDTVSRSTIHRTLKKTNLNLG
jgi:transposase